MTATKRCYCVSDHNPEPQLLVRHHILPKSWGGSDTADNLVDLCPTTHENVHTLLDHYVRYDRQGLGEPPWSIRQHFGPFARALVEQAWRNRPERPGYTLGK